MTRSTPSLGLVVTAGGYGLRLGSLGPKQYVPILGVPMVQRTIAVLDSCPLVQALAVVVNDEDVDYCNSEIVSERFDSVVAVVAGGRERGLSVRNGLRVLHEKMPDLDLLGVHDGARPLVLCEDIERLLGRLTSEDDLAGALLGVPSTDTLKVVDGKGVVQETPPRRLLWRAQTPQIFRREALMRAYEQDEHLLLEATDDAFLVEGQGGRVAVVEGSAENLKVTTIMDLHLAEQILAERRR